MELSTMRSLNTPKKSVYEAQKICQILILILISIVSIEAQVLHGFKVKNTPQGPRYYYQITNNSTNTIKNITVYFSDTYIGYRNKAVNLDHILPGQVSTYGFSENDLPLGSYSVAVFKAPSKEVQYDYPPSLDSPKMSAIPNNRTNGIPDYTQGLESVDQFLNQPHVRESIKQNQGAQRSERDEAYLKEMLEMQERRALRNIPKY